MLCFSHHNDCEMTRFAVMIWSVRSDSIWIKFRRAAIKSFNHYSSKTEAKQEVSRPGCWKSLVRTLHRPNSTSDPGISTLKASLSSEWMWLHLWRWSLGGSMPLTCIQMLWRGTLSETTECHLSIYFIAIGQKKTKKTTIPIIRTKGWILASIIGQADCWSIPCFDHRLSVCLHF